MARKTVERYRCRSCDAITADEDLLRAPNPFQANDTILGCPNCKSATLFVLVCDVLTCGVSYDAQAYSEIQIPHDTLDRIRAAVGEKKGGE